MPSKEQRKLTK
uniref:Uncharacterized protein n=1 Tax=Anguilla anguilla TaxID=7936 RepID=A0A0E9XD66_ANGAN